MACLDLPPVAVEGPDGWQQQHSRGDSAAIARMPSMDLNLAARLLAWLRRAVVTLPVEFFRSCHECSSFAVLVARRVDQIFAALFFVVYVILLGVMLWMAEEVGEHKRMFFGMSRPGNM